MMNEAHYPIDSPRLNRLVEYNLVLIKAENFKEKGLISCSEYSKVIKELNKLYKDIRE